MKIALSTLACSDWTLEHIVTFAESAGYEGLDHRTFGHGSTGLVYDPCLVGPGKLRGLLGAHGLESSSLATSIRYDAPVFPPVLGRVISDYEASVKATKSMVRTAASIECPHVRVFAFELPKGESRSSGLRRIQQRLEMALTTARHTGVKLVLENGGSFPLASDLAEIITRINNPLLMACYNPVVGHAAGEDIVQAVRMLGRMLAIVKLKDLRGLEPVAIGDGDVPLEPMIGELVRRKFNGWGVVEWDRLWFKDSEKAVSDPTAVLEASAATAYKWVGAAQATARGATPAMA
ncbi:MAG: TIM barrel protein [Planctomycetota bacterium]